MNSYKLFGIKFVLFFLPETRFFGLKRKLFRFAGATIGENVRICSSVSIIGNGNLSIGDNTWIGHQTCIISSSSIIIGKNVDIAPRVYIGTGTHVVDIKSPNISGAGISENITIKDGCWVCVGSIILPGVELGIKSITAGGSLVNKNVLPFTIVGGVPAKLISKLK
ncbi:acyltransferase [Gramella sp. AN32]|uniref:Acyltransferase n=1 Tax=Christiangramia antarctica TaxID=2058158 RepID=A0ABW5XB56_9FLAO|nr:acyltransferase [Gramella sp. AN32]MCM4155369.1 acyltransferase [Gramella sp. AN32]